jgi:hypothetical protein
LWKQTLLSHHLSATSEQGLEPEIAENAQIYQKDVDRATAAVLADRTSRFG